MADISVIICTHDPRPDYLSHVLDALRTQTLHQNNWELLLVDNASQTLLAEKWDLLWHPHARHVRENTPGLTPARLRGITESRGDLLVFVDDDNILAPDFLEQASILSARYPYLGVFGAGVLEPEFEAPPPPELVPRLAMVAIRTVPTVLWSNNPKDYSCMPVGAGLCVRRRIAIAYRQLLETLNVSAVVGRQGAKLFSGEDDLFSWASAREGQGFGIFPALSLRHLMPTKRLTREYFRRLAHDHAFSHGILRYLLTGSEPPSMNQYNYVRLFLHWLRRGTFSVQCQWAELSGVLAAGRFIAERDLRPLEPELWQRN